jgi:alcohol dehydrogenase YqhD (iron-dependent ADH family)
MHHDVARFAQVAERVWGIAPDPEDPESVALAGIEALQQVLISIGMPKNFEELGAKEEDIPTLVKNLCYGNGRDGIIYGFVNLNEEDCTKIYKMMI